jgi:hypothetical protein
VHTRLLFDLKFARESAASRTLVWEELRQFN